MADSEKIKVLKVQLQVTEKMSKRKFLPDKARKKFIASANELRKKIKKL